MYQLYSLYSDKIVVDRCIPFKYRNSSEENGDTSDKVVEVLMINSTSGPGLLFPKVKICTCSFELNACFFYASRLH